MKDLPKSEPDWRFTLMKNRKRTFLREVADADEPFGLENADDFAEMFVACGKQSFALARQQFVRSAVASAFFHERERTIIQNDVLPEKILRITETFGEQSPQTFAADFAPVTIEAEHRAFRIFFSRLVDLRTNPEPIAHGRDLSERNSGLRHAERAWIHSEKDHALRAIAVAAEIKFVRAPRVSERVVNMRDRQREFQFPDSSAEPLRGSD